MVSPHLPDAAKIEAVRQALPATGAGVYLNTGTCGPLPAETARAMADVAEYELTVGRASLDYYLESLQRMAEARAAAAAILTADVDTVALTHSTTAGINAIVWGLDWRATDRIVSTNLEHTGCYGALEQVSRRRSVELALADVGDGGDDERTMAALDRAILPGTRLVVVSHVAWNTGAILPIPAIADLAHRRGALLLVDGAQSAGALRVAVADLGADAYATSAQKWLLGPEGMGALWVAPTLLDRVQPTFAGHATYEEPGPTPPFSPWPDARRLEWATFHRPSVVGFARSCGWLAMFVGLDWIYTRGSELAARTADGLAAIPGVEVVTPRGQMATLVTFRINGWLADAALDELGRRVFVIGRSIPARDWIRFSIGFFNSEEELERTVSAVAELARHTPDTLPRRPALTILGEG